MKKIYHSKFLLRLARLGMSMALFAVAAMSLQAQEMRPPVPQNIDVCPEYGLYSGEPSTPTPDALYDIQFSHNVTAVAGSQGWTAAIWLNNRFWVGKFATDTVMQLDINGALIQKFQIAGLGTSFIRSFTTDGEYLYASTNTTTIYRIDTATHTLAPPHITSASASLVRHCTYDPNIGTSGGFYVGNYATDIDAIDMTGAVQFSIPSANHGLTGIYGSALDNATPGSPYLWVFNQLGGNGAQIVRLDLPSGTPTVLANHNVLPDFQTTYNLTGGPAGGLFIAQNIVPGKWTIGGLIQSAPSNVIFGYELDSLALLNGDVASEGLRPTKGYTRLPASQTFSETYSVQATNLGGTTISMLHVDFSVKFNGGATVYTNTQMASNVASGQTVTLTSTGFSPANGIGTYDVMAIAYPMSGSDPNHANDTSFFQLLVTDSTYARDDDQPDGGNGYAVSGTDWAYALTNFEVIRADSLSSIWIELANPVSGDTTYAVVASTLNGIPGAVLYTGPVQIIGGGSTMVLPVPGGLNLTPGIYSFGCYEGGPTTINLAQSPNLFTAGMNFFFTPTNGWTQSGIQTARFIRPNFGNVVGVGTENGFASGVHVFPNPSRDKFYVAFRDQPNADVNITVADLVGHVVRNITVNPSLQQQTLVDLAGETNGIYFIRIDNGTQSTVRKVVLAR